VNEFNLPEHILKKAVAFKGRMDTQYKIKCFPIFLTCMFKYVFRVLVNWSFILIAISDENIPLFAAHFCVVLNLSIL